MAGNPTKASQPTHVNTRTKKSPLLSAEQVALLVEESSLGTAGARQLRDRTPPQIKEVIKARAHVTRTDPDWWNNHRNDPNALVAKAEEVAPERWAVALTLLRLAAQLGHREAAAAIKGEDGAAWEVATETGTSSQHQTPHDFADFYREHVKALTDVLRSETGLSEPHARMAMVSSMSWAFDEWEELRTRERPEDLVLGRALQHCRSPAGGHALHQSRGTAGTHDTGLRMTGALAVAAAPVRAGARDRATPERRNTDHAVSLLYASQYRSLVRLAAMLVRDVETAEEVVQDAFVAMHGGWRRLRNTDKALSYLRQSVVNRSRSVLRHRAIVEKYTPRRRPETPSVEAGGVGELARTAVVDALSRLPARQREALVLRYYADLSEIEIANAMGISTGAVRAHTARGMTALRTVLEQLA